MLILLYNIKASVTAHPCTQLHCACWKSELFRTY